MASRLSPSGQGTFQGGEVKAPHFCLLQSDQDQPKLKAILNIGAYLIHLHGFGFISDEQLFLREQNVFWHPPEYNVSAIA